MTSKIVPFCDSWYYCGHLTSPRSVNKLLKITTGASYFRSLHVVSAHFSVIVTSVLHSLPLLIMLVRCWDTVAKLPWSTSPALVAMRAHAFWFDRHRRSLMLRQVRKLSIIFLNAETIPPIFFFRKNNDLHSLCFQKHSYLPSLRLFSLQSKLTVLSELFQIKWPD